MTTVFIIINVLITITALILCIRAWKGLRAVSKPQSRTVDKPSELARRREELEIVGKAWLYSMEHGLPLSARHERGMMNRLEREVAAMENELFGTPEEATPKPETPKRQSEIKVDFIGNNIPGEYYGITCSFCGWSGSGASMETVEAKRAQHEREHL